jgi:hypothetical protein
MSNKDYSNNNGFSKVILVFVGAIISITTYSYFTSSKNPNPIFQIAIPTFEPEIINQQDLEPQSQGFRDLKIDNYSLRIPAEFNIIIDQGLENSYMLDSPMKPYRVRINLINEPFNPANFKPWIEYEKQNSEFTYTESSVNGYKIYQTLQEPYLTGVVTTYISLSTTKSLVITGSQNAGDIDPELTYTSSLNYYEYMDIVNSIR